MNYKIRFAKKKDIEQIMTLEHLLDSESLKEKIRRKEIIVCLDNSNVTGMLRFNWFWDMFPFINLLWVVEDSRKKNIGSKLVDFLIHFTKGKNNDAIFTSTQANEGAQHFWRKIGFTDSGGFTFKKEPFELIMIKHLK